MDVLTHLLLPYGAALFLLGLHRSPAEGPASWLSSRLGLDASSAGAAALVFGLAGASPDLDSLYSWLKSYGGLYWLQHRGFSHTLLGAPLHGLVIVGVLHLLAQASPTRFRRLRFRPLFVAAAMIGSLTHLLLDAVTFAGIPLFWPFADGRVTLGLFHWLVIWLFPLIAIFFLVKWWRGWGHVATVRMSAAVLVILLVLAGVRVAYTPTEEGDGALVFSRSSPFEWTILRPLENGTWETYRLRGDTRTDFAWYDDAGPRDAEATAAIQQVRDTNDYRGFQMGAFGPEVVIVVPDGAAYNVTFMDVAQVTEVRLGHNWTPAEPKGMWGILKFRLTDHAIEVLDAGW